MRLDTLDKLKIYYLCMMADGEVSANEQEIFTKICKSSNISDTAKVNIISECESKVGVLSDDNSDKIIEIIGEIIYDEFDLFLIENGADDIKCYIDKGNQTTLLWNLINLSYADSDYSESEQKIINFFAKTFQFSETILLDMQDTAETMLALMKKKEWAKSLSYEKADCEIKQIEKDMSKLHDNMKLLIQEAEVA